MTDRESRLPKWAQDQLANYRREIGSLTRYAAECRGEVEGANIFVRNYAREDQPLPIGAVVVFYPDGPDGARVRRSIHVYLEGRRLRVQGDNAVTVRPYASNSLTIELDE